MVQAVLDNSSVWQDWASSADDEETRDAETGRQRPEPSLLKVRARGICPANRFLAAAAGEAQVKEGRGEEITGKRGRAYVW